MKIFVITESYFRLPDDFKGNEADALRVMADYFDKHEAHHDDYNESKSAWENFMDKWPHDTRRYVGSNGVQELIDGKFVRVTTDG